MRVFDGLKFRRGSSPVHRLDPRVKFVVSCVILALAFMFLELLPIIILFLAQIPLVFIARVGREWSRTLRGSLFLVLLIFLTNLIVGFFSEGYSLTRGTLTYSTSMALRFLTLTASFSIFFLTTSPDDLGLALEQTRIPYEFCFAFTTAVRFVPVLANEAQTIIDAQRSRGLELDKGSFLKRVRNYIPILIPLIVGAIRRSLELAEAMESRAFGAKRRRTNLYVLKLKAMDYLTVSVSLLVLAVSIYIRHFIPIPVVEIPMPF
ncbi:MAG: energy-coupling factor transporter transmembrane component T family protein [Candidatus Bathyarchaeia archaeon]